MSFQHKITFSWSRAGDNSGELARSTAVTADGEDNRDISIPENSTNLLVAFALDVSQLQSLYIESDQDVTMKTNSSSTPADTLSLKAGKPVVWLANHGHANPFSTDITALYFTNTTACTVKIRAAVDATV